MTRWTIKIQSNSREDDTLVMRVLRAAANSGLRYAVESKEITVPGLDKQPKIVT